MRNQKTAAHMQFLTFRLAQETFAIEVLKAREIIDCIDPTKVPQMPAELLGVINLRGKVVPVINLRCKFGMPDAERTRDNCIIIIEIMSDGEKALIGILVDAVKEVLNLNNDQIEPPPKMGTRLKTEYIRGMGKRGDEFMIILDADRVFSTDDLNLYQETVAV